MTSQRVHSLILVSHESGTPHDDEWNSSLALLASVPLEQLRVMVFTEGGAPSPKQQLRLSHTLARGARSLRVAVVSDSTAIRFTASAMALFLTRIRSFTRADLAEACNYLELDPSERGAALAELKRPLR